MEVEEVEEVEVVEEEAPDLPVNTTRATTVIIRAPLQPSKRAVKEYLYFQEAALSVDKMSLMEGLTLTSFKLTPAATERKTT